MSLNNAKRISFICGALFVFFVNKKLVFKNYEKFGKQLFYFVILYFCSFVINSLSHDFVLKELNMSYIAFLIATSMSTIINYIGQKFWIFKTNV